MLFAPKEKGQGLVEYAIILALVAIVVIAEGSTNGISTATEESRRHRRRVLRSHFQCLFRFIVRLFVGCNFGVLIG